MPEWIKRVVSWLVSLVCAREKEPSIKTCGHSHVNVIKQGDQKIDVSGGSQVSIVQQNNYQLTPHPQKEDSLTDAEMRLLKAIKGTVYSVHMIASKARLDESVTKALLATLQKKGVVLASSMPFFGGKQNYRYSLSEKGENILAEKERNEVTRKEVGSLYNSIKN